LPIKSTTKRNRPTKMPVMIGIETYWYTLDGTRAIDVAAHRRGTRLKINNSNKKERRETKTQPSNTTNP
jgi:hypothetical protein